MSVPDLATARRERIIGSVKSDRIFIFGSVVVAAASVLVVSLLSDLPDALLAPLATLLAGGITGYVALRSEEKRWKRELERERRKAAADRRREEKEVRDDARPIAIQLHHQFTEVADLIRNGYWPSSGRVEVQSLTAERRDALAKRLPDEWSWIEFGLQEMQQVAAKSEADSRPLDNPVDRLEGLFHAEMLLFAAGKLNEATWDDDHIKLVAAQEEHAAQQDREAVAQIREEIKDELAAAGGEPHV